MKRNASLILIHALLVVLTYPVRADLEVSSDIAVDFADGGADAARMLALSQVEDAVFSQVVAPYYQARLSIWNRKSDLSRLRQDYLGTLFQYSVVRERATEQHTYELGISAQLSAADGIQLIREYQQKNSVAEKPRLELSLRLVQLSDSETLESDLLTFIKNYFSDTDIELVTRSDRSKRWGYTLSLEIRGKKTTKTVYGVDMQVETADLRMSAARRGEDLTLADWTQRFSHSGSSAQSISGEIQNRLRDELDSVVSRIEDDAQGREYDSAPMAVVVEGDNEAQQLMWQLLEQPSLGVKSIDPQQKGFDGGKLSYRVDYYGSPRVFYRELQVRRDKGSGLAVTMKQLDNKKLVVSASSSGR